MNNLSPCKDCVKRNLGCHSKCLDYLRFKKQRDIERLLEKNARLTEFVPIHKKGR